MKKRPIMFSAPMVRAILDGRKTQTRRILKPTASQVKVLNPDYSMRWQPGDTLWVRETWKPGAWREDGRVAVDYRASLELTNTPWCHPPNFDDIWPVWTDELMRNGSVCDHDGIHHWQAGNSPMRWRPSIHMPQWASRITLAVEAVRVERLQDIGEADACAEGWPKDENGPIVWHSALWDTINGAGSWDANPWVSVTTFRRVP